MHGAGPPIRLSSTSHQLKMILFSILWSYLLGFLLQGLCHSLKVSALMYLVLFPISVFQLAYSIKHSFCIPPVPNICPLVTHFFIHIHEAWKWTVLGPWCLLPSLPIEGPVTGSTTLSQEDSALRRYWIEPWCQHGKNVWLGSYRQ